MPDKKKIAIVLAGSGVYDGSEIHEAVMCMYAVKKHGADYTLFAPDIPQHHVINHVNGDEMKEDRFVLIESARIARGDIRALKEFDAAEFDGLVFPGGFGAAKNLSTFAFDGPDCEVNEEVSNAVNAMVEAGKPMGALCISPVIFAKVLGDVKLTVGQDSGTIDAVKSMGATHSETNHGEVVVDEKYKLATTPCYMLDANIVQIHDGAMNVVRKVLEMS